MDKKNSCGYGISYHPCLIVQRMNKTKRGACQNLGIGILRKSWIITIRKFILHKHYIFQILKYRIFCRYPIFVNLGKNQRYFYTHEGSQKNKINNYYKPRSVVGPDNNFPNFSSLEFSWSCISDTVFVLIGEWGCGGWMKFSAFPDEGGTDGVLDAVVEGVVCLRLFFPVWRRAQKYNYC